MWRTEERWKARAFHSLKVTDCKKQNKAPMLRAKKTIEKKGTKKFNLLILNLFL